MGRCTVDGAVQLLRALTNAGYRERQVLPSERSPLVPGPCGDAELGNTGS